MKLIQKIIFMGFLLLVAGSCQNRMTENQYSNWFSINSDSFLKEKISGNYLFKVKYVTPEVRVLLSEGNIKLDSLYIVFQEQHFFTLTLLNENGVSVFSKLTIEKKEELEDAITDVFKNYTSLTINGEKIDCELFHYEGEVGGKAGVVAHFIYPSNSDKSLSFQIDSNKIFSETIIFEYNTANYPKLKIY